MPASEKNIKRRIVVGDIHGCFNTFKTLVENKIQLSKNDQLFLLGDYVNKGPKSAETIDYIISLKENGYHIATLRGNHEDILLDVEENTPEILPWILRDSPNMLEEKRLKTKYRTFFKSLLYYIELDDFILVHAAFNFKIQNPFSDKNAMLWLRKFKNKKQFIQGKTIIHGHQPQNIEDIIENVNKRKKVIGLDNGVCYIKKHKIYDFQKMGNLCALNIDDYVLYIQKNVEKYQKK